MHVFANQSFKATFGKNITHFKKYLLRSILFLMFQSQFGGAVCPREGAIIMSIRKVLILFFVICIGNNLFSIEISDINGTWIAHWIYNGYIEHPDDNNRNINEETFIWGKGEYKPYCTVFEWDSNSRTGLYRSDIRPFDIKNAKKIKEDQILIELRNPDYENWSAEIILHFIRRRGLTPRPLCGGYFLFCDFVTFTI
jgi:hypothetical protein